MVPTKLDMVCCCRPRQPLAKPCISAGMAAVSLRRLPGNRPGCSMQHTSCVAARALAAAAHLATATAAAAVASATAASAVAAAASAAPSPFLVGILWARRPVGAGRSDSAALGPAPGQPCSPREREGAEAPCRLSGKLPCSLQQLSKAWHSGRGRPAELQRLMPTPTRCSPGLLPRPGSRLLMQRGVLPAVVILTGPVPRSPAINSTAGSGWLSKRSGCECSGPSEPSLQSKQRSCGGLSDSCAIGTFVPGEQCWSNTLFSSAVCAQFLLFPPFAAFLTLAEASSARGPAIIQSALSHVPGIKCHPGGESSVVFVGPPICPFCAQPSSLGPLGNRHGSPAQP